MIHAILIDDEEKARVTLKGKLELFCPEVTVLAEAGSVAEGLAALQQHKPEILFLDIQLSGESGFDLLEALKELDEVNPEVIFITAHDEFAIRAIKFSALDYLLKPIDAEELVKAVRKVEERRALPAAVPNFDVLIENIRQASDMPRKIVIPTSDGMHVVKVSQIIRLESSSNYTTFHLHQAKEILASRTLKDFDNILQAYQFLRVHKSHLVNINYIKRFIPQDGGYIVLEDNSRVPVSNRKKEMLLEELRKV